MTAAQTAVGSTGQDGHGRSLVLVGGPPGEAHVGRSSLMDLWMRRCSMLVVASVAAYSSYEHQRLFAATGGADPAGARLWPLSVDGLVLLASIGLLRTGPHTSPRNRYTLWAAFSLGISVSLAAGVKYSRVEWRRVVL